MSYQVRYTRGARDDLVRLYQFLLDHDVDAAERALSAIRQGTDALGTFPFTCRKVEKHNPFLRELVVSFGSSGYVVLFEIEDRQQITILAVRHQREDDYH